MDTVILAAGRGGRMTELINPYLKPLLPTLDGKPNLLNLVNAASPVSEQIVVVVAPQNALAICEVLEECDKRVRVVIQRLPNGPGDALLHGIEMLPLHGRALVLLCDEIVTPDLVKQFVQNPTAISVRYLDPKTNNVERFTRYDHETKRWVEKKPLDKNQVNQYETMCWSGPLVVYTDQVRYAFRNEHHVYEGELLIGPNLHYLSSTHVETGAVDVGTPDAYMHWMEGR
jgi:bifunctional N-acetylglucosamine-1-phosphate-uridyltransferase/glucosamine-1-phosphate-acetyltransferase GlmU-like protein